jgi:hypothetical protein
LFLRNSSTYSRFLFVCFYEIHPRLPYFRIFRRARRSWWKQ